MRIYNNSYMNAAKQKVLLKVFRVSFLCFLFTMAVLAIATYYHAAEWNFHALRNNLVIGICIVGLAEIVGSHFIFWKEFSQIPLAGINSTFDKVRFTVIHDFGIALSIGASACLNAVSVYMVSNYGKNYQYFLQTCAEAGSSEIPGNIVTYATDMLQYTQSLWLLMALGYTAAFIFLWFLFSKISYCVSYARKSLCKAQVGDTIQLMKKDSNTIKLDLTRECLLFCYGSVIVHSMRGNVFKVYKESELEKIMVITDNDYIHLEFNQNSQSWEMEASFPQPNQI